MRIRRPHIITAIMSYLASQQMMSVAIEPRSEPSTSRVKLQGDAGAYGMRLVNDRRYKAWKRKQKRRVRNANGGK